MRKALLVSVFFLIAGTLFATPPADPPKEEIKASSKVRAANKAETGDATEWKPRRGLNAQSGSTPSGIKRLKRNHGLLASPQDHYKKSRSKYSRKHKKRVRTSVAPPKRF